MVFSTISIHVSSVEFGFAMDDDASFRQKLRVIVKTAPIFIPFIIFKAGALAVIFADLKYGGLVHLTVWIILATVVVIIFDEDDVGWIEGIIYASRRIPSRDNGMVDCHVNRHFDRLNARFFHCIGLLFQVRYVSLC